MNLKNFPMSRTRDPRWNAIPRTIAITRPKAIPPSNLSTSTVKVWPLEGALELAYSGNSENVEAIEEISSKEKEDKTEKEQGNKETQEKEEVVELPEEIVVPRPSRDTYSRNTEQVARLLLWGVMGVLGGLLGLWFVRHRKKKLEDERRLALLKEKREKELF